MAEIKTKKTTASVAKFIASIQDSQKRKDSAALVKIFSDITKEKAALWGSSIIGFGQYHYKGRSSEGDWPMTGFSPRAQTMTIYIMLGFKEHTQLLKKIGKHKISGGSCLYFKELGDLHVPTLKTLIKQSVAAIQKKYPA